MNDKYAFLAAPFNTGNDYRSCKNGGEWTAAQSGQKIQVTVSGYEIDLGQLPYTDAKNDPAVYTYYNPNTSKGYWDIQTACFSAGEFWILQPFYDAQGGYIADEYGNGNFTMTVEDGNLMVTGESGQSIEEKDDNSNQMVTTDDRESVSMALEQPGEIEQYIRYAGTDVTNAYQNEGKDWSLSGGEISIQEQLAHLGAEGLHTAVAYDDLIKFDDRFFDIDSVQIGTVNGVENMTWKFLYGAKADKSGWDHAGKEPDEDGYDTEMMEATADDLVFFSDLGELKAQGYTCVAVLMEVRGVASSQSTEIYFTAQGSLKDTAKQGKVYMVTHSAKAWNKEDVQEAAAKALGKEVSELNDEDYKTYAQQYLPSRADQMTAPDYGTDYPGAFWTNDSETREGLKNYLKSQYDENGYKDGTAGRNYGDSCLVAEYATQISKNRAQTTVGSDGQPGEKYSYDLDSGQSIADYTLIPSAIRTEGAFSNDDTVTTTVYVEDTLPKGLTYIPFSGYWGGNYTQNGEGKQGTVTGGVPAEPEIRENEDGTTTLLWTLENVTITAEAVTRIDPIYYSCDIGNKDSVQNNQELMNTVKIWSEDEQLKDFAEVNGNLADVGIRVVKNLAVSLSKLADQTEVEAGEDMGFTMNVGNNAGNPLEVIAVDSLPYNGDDAGSAFTGECIVTEFSIKSLQEQFGGENFKLYYTLDESLRGKTSKDLTKENFTDPASQWVELTVDQQSGNVTLPQGKFRPVAFAAVGSLPANQTLKMHVTINLPEGRAGEHAVNRLTNSTLESYGRSYVVGRTLEGVVWLDADKNGLRADSEEMKDGVTATLMLLKDGGDPSRAEDYEPYEVNGKAVSVATGQQINVITGTVSEYITGNYKFVNLPEGTFGVRFSDGTLQMADYETSPADIQVQLYADGEKSGEPVTLNEGNGWSHTWRELDEKSDGEVIEYTVKEVGEDSGKITFSNGAEYGVAYGGSAESGYTVTNSYTPETIEISGSKTWDDADDQDGIRPDTVKIRLFADGKDTGKTLVLSEENRWSGIFADLDEYKNGEKINYSIKEDAVNGYHTVISGDAEKGFVVTNSHTPVKTESTPETGDRGTPALWIVLMGLAGTAIVTASYLAEKKRKTYRK